jgi:hypothetical protein
MSSGSGFRVEFLDVMRTVARMISVGRRLAA